MNAHTSSVSVIVSKCHTSYIMPDNKAAVTMAMSISGDPQCKPMLKRPRGCYDNWQENKWREGEKIGARFLKPVYTHINTHMHARTHWDSSDSLTAACWSKFTWMLIRNNIWTFCSAVKEPVPSCHRRKWSFWFLHCLSILLHALTSYLWLMFSSEHKCTSTSICASVYMSSRTTEHLTASCQLRVLITR